MAAVEVVAQHGWGFGAWCWDGWREVLPADFALHCLDRGYFGQVETAASGRPHIVITHSLGLHLVPPALIEGAKLIIALSGFRHFHSARLNHARRSRRMVEQMSLRLGQEPQALLTDFYIRCGAVDVDGRQGLPDVGRLSEDLQLLQESVLNPGLWQTGVPVRIVHGGDDRIVALERGDELHELVSGSELTVLPEAGHALPITHIRECWQVIERDWHLRHCER